MAQRKRNHYWRKGSKQGKIGYFWSKSIKIYSVRDLSFNLTNVVFLIISCIPSKKQDSRSPHRFNVSDFQLVFLVIIWLVSVEPEVEKLFHSCCHQLSTSVHKINCEVATDQLLLSFYQLVNWLNRLVNFKGSVTSGRHSRSIKEPLNVSESGIYKFLGSRSLTWFPKSISTICNLLVWWRTKGTTDSRSWTRQRNRKSG